MQAPHMESTMKIATRKSSIRQHLLAAVVIGAVALTVGCVSPSPEAEEERNKRPDRTTRTEMDLD